MAVHDAATQAAKDELAPRDAVLAMADRISGNRLKTGAAPRGSNARLTKDGAAAYKIVPPGEADPATDGAAPKLALRNKIMGSSGNKRPR